MKSDYACQKSGESFCPATEMDVTTRLKAMHTSSGRARNKSQADSGA